MSSPEDPRLQCCQIVPNPAEVGMNLLMLFSTKVCCSVFRVEEEEDVSLLVSLCQGQKNI